MSCACADVAIKSIADTRNSFFIKLSPKFEGWSLYQWASSSKGPHRESVVVIRPQSDHGVTDLINNVVPVLGIAVTVHKLGGLPPRILRVMARLARAVISVSHTMSRSAAMAGLVRSSARTTMNYGDSAVTAIPPA
ncbi:hypothetical protein [Bradyrhizobium japonicum]|uniref:hypothetical protein n=1 Tax=Bradyrhizobium japonicum TaxID=375 RepID=UPI001FCCE3CC|nr:hypothetical protein [Bradyrhizobium japonicum]